MGILQRLLKKRPNKADAEQMLAEARAIGNLVDNVVNRLLEQHFNVLLNRPITYLISGVWGASKEGPIDKAQEEIHGEVEASLAQILEALNIEGLNETKKYSILFLIRELVISRIGYALEKFKNSAAEGEGASNESASLLDDIKPVGEA